MNNFVKKVEPAFYKVEPVNIAGNASLKLMMVLKTSGCEYALKIMVVVQCVVLLNMQKKE